MRRPLSSPLFPYTTLFRSELSTREHGRLRREFAETMGNTDVKIYDVNNRLRYGNGQLDGQDRKSTRLNSSHVKISYAVFCLKKKTHPRDAHTGHHGRT